MTPAVSRSILSVLALLAGSACEGSPFTSDDGGADASTTDSDDGPTIILVHMDGTTGAQSDGGAASLCAAPKSLDCNGTCVDPTLPANCGSCGHACPGADGGHATCAAGGVCGLSCDPSSSTPSNCNGACVNLQTDPLHCGGCAVACSPPSSTHGKAACLAASDGGGACGVACDTGYHACHGDCLPSVDTPSVTGDPCVLSEAFGVFVSPTGSDIAGNGSRTQPYATVGHAMDIAATGTKRVYACASAGTYTENLTVGASRDGVAVYGGLDCTPPAETWTYSAGRAATVSPSAGYALQLAAVIMGVTFEDFAFRAADATTAGASSIAVFVAGATGIVAFHRVAMVAGAGMAGAPGANAGTSGDPSNWFGGSLNGKDATATAPGVPGKCACGDGTMGTGGQGGSPTQTPAAGLPAYGGGSAGTNHQACGGGGSPPDNGADAPWGTPDPSSTAHGTFAAGGWTPASGGGGSKGKVGQGGGGGGDGPDDLGFGGGGACGGCGGAGGSGGGGGGSSIALLSYRSVVTLVACTLTAGHAGAGGKGGDGEGGQIRGGVAGNAALGGCQGGIGGNGAGGNGGQGGAGGLSLGIGYSGVVPTIDPATTTTVGTSGAGGAGGAAGSSASANANPGASGAKGPDGLTQTAPLPL